MTELHNLLQENNKLELFLLPIDYSKLNNHKLISLSIIEIEEEKEYLSQIISDFDYKIFDDWNNELNTLSDYINTKSLIHKQLISINTAGVKIQLYNNLLNIKVKEYNNLYKNALFIYKIMIDKFKNSHHNEKKNAYTWLIINLSIIHIKKSYLEIIIDKLYDYIMIWKEEFKFYLEMLIKKEKKYICEEDKIRCMIKNIINIKIKINKIRNILPNIEQNIENKIKFIINLFPNLSFLEIKYD